MPVTPTPGYTPEVTYDLVDLDYIKAILGIDPTDNRKDEQYEALIPAVSRTIVNYAGRNFASPLVTETRQYTYSEDDGGFLDIDDTAQITSVAYANPYGDDVTLTPDQWRALPPRRNDSPVFTYLAIAGLSTAGYRPPSPMMGFERNIDVLWAEGRLAFGSYMPTFKVTAEWGWPDVPEDVKVAVVWTLQEWITRPNAEAMTAEHIEGYSRSWGRLGTPSTSEAVPQRARDILAAYVKADI